MKMQSNKLRNWGVAMAFLAIGNPLVTSCSKDQNSTEVAPVSDKLTISISGINVDPSFKSASNDLSYDVKEFGDADIAIAIGDVNQSDAIKFRNSNVYEPVEQDVQYVVYIYEGNNLVASKLLSAGTPGTIDDLNPTTNYKWVAVSYNSTEAAPSIAPAAELALPENTDVLYASGDLNLSQNSSIEIAFNHAMARLAVELNTIGVFGEISPQTAPTITLTSGGLRTGSLNLLSGDITASSTTFSPTLTYSDFEQVEENKNDILQTYFYTVPNSASENQSVTVNISNLMINHYDGNEARTYFTAGQNFTLNIAAEKGKSRKATLNIVESPLITNINNNLVQWGRSNLYYRGDNLGIRSYGFYSKNELTSRADGFFGFGALTPLRFATSQNQGDPCALVYPQGLWRQPENDDFNGLVNEDPIQLTQLTDQLGPLGQIVDASGIGGLVNLITGLLSNTLFAAINVPAPNSSLAPSPYQYGQYSISGGAPTTGSNAFGDQNNSQNNLRFYYNGQISNLSVLQAVGGGDGLVNLGLSNLSASLAGVNLLNTNIPLLNSYERATALWTSERGAEVLGLASAGSWGYFGTVGRSFSILSLGSRFHMANRTGEILNGVDALGIDVLSTTFKNVRCVRAQTN